MRFFYLWPLITLGMNFSFVQAMCAGELTINQKIRLVRAEPSRERMAALTRLMNQAYGPALDQISAHFLSLTRDEIRAAAARFPRREATFDRPPSRAKHDDEPELYDNYRGSICFGEHAIATAPYNSHNYAVMHRLCRALATIQREIEHRFADPAADSRWTPAEHFLNIQSYTHMNVTRGFGFANEGLAQAAAQLTASPFDGWTPERIFGHALRRNGKNSLMVRFALMLGPGFLGQVGRTHYVKDALEKRHLDDGSEEVDFSPTLSRVVRQHRAERARAQDYAHFEFGFGCPVAHPLERGRASPLQRYLDAVAYVYDQIEN